MFNCCPFQKWKTLSDGVAHQDIHIEHPAVLSWTDAEALQVQAVFVVKDFVQSVTQLCSQLLTSSAFKLRGCIGWTSNSRWKTIIKWGDRIFALESPWSLGCVWDSSDSKQVIQHYLLVAGYQQTTKSNTKCNPIALWSLYVIRDTFCSS